MWQLTLPYLQPSSMSPSAKSTLLLITGTNQSPKHQFLTQHWCGWPHERFQCTYLLSQLQILHVTALSLSFKLTWGAWTMGRQRRRGIGTDVATVSPLWCWHCSLLDCAGSICEGFLWSLWAVIGLCTSIIHNSLTAAQTWRTSWRITMFWAYVNISRHPVTHMKHVTMRDMRFVEQHCWYFRSSWMWCRVTGKVVKNISKHLQFHHLHGQAFQGEPQDEDIENPSEYFETTDWTMRCHNQQDWNHLYVTVSYGNTTKQLKQMCELQLNLPISTSLYTACVSIQCLCEVECGSFLLWATTLWHQRRLIWGRNTSLKFS